MNLNVENQEEYLEIIGARVHNLKNIEIKIPRDKLVVITGLSGSGKSSLAFDTIYAEGQRRYIETFSSYARQFLGKPERPDVDKINGLSPVISIEQKTINKNPRSTVGTITEIYDFLRLLFARTATAYSYITGEKMVKYSEKEILSAITSKFNCEKISILSPIVKGRKGHYRELFEQIRKQGYLKARIDGEIKDLTPKMQLDRYKIHDIEVVVDRLQITEESLNRLNNSIQIALKMGKGSLMIHSSDTNQIQYYSRLLMCPTSGISYNEPAPNIFSFNSPYGACKKCNGLGEVSEVDIDKIIPDRKKSILNGGIAPLGEIKNNWIFKQLDIIAKQYQVDLKDPIENLDDSFIDLMLFGSDESFKIKTETGVSADYYTFNYEGIVNFIKRQEEENPSATITRWAREFMNTKTCPTCNGSRLQIESLFFKIGDKNIANIASFDLIEVYEWLNEIIHQFDKNTKIVANEIIKEIKTRTEFLLNVGLGYLNLNRSANTLSGGEAQRIRLATQIGTSLTGVLYILDEPSIGLHQRDNEKLIKALLNLRNLGNSVMVVEHDKDMMLSGDYIIDVGPGAGHHGGKIMAAGNYNDIIKSSSITAKYLKNEIQIKIPSKRRKGNGKFLELLECSGHNLKNVNLKIPLGTFTCITGVSGSGKSSLIIETLYPILNQHFFNAVKKPLPYQAIKGLEYLDKVIEIDQSPIGRSPRSNPATYTGVFNEIRNLFSQMPEALIRGYKPGRFSFNVKGGRCETCGGAGVKTIEMNFLPDVFVVCETCNGKRYNKETLDVRFKGKNISNVLDMEIETALDFFEAVPSINQKIKSLHQVGLGYITLGQPSTTLSGGEAQRIKLATELAKKDTGNTIYILDEPTTGLHFEDIRILLEVLQKLVDHGNTVLVIEHNLDVIKCADYIIDIGPESGKEGGKIVAEGTPEKIVKNKESITAKFLAKELAQ